MVPFCNISRLNAFYTRCRMILNYSFFLAWFYVYCYTLEKNGFTLPWTRPGRAGGSFSCRCLSFNGTGHQKHNGLIWSQRHTKACLNSNLSTWRPLAASCKRDKEAPSLKAWLEKQISICFMYAISPDLSSTYFKTLSMWFPSCPPIFSSNCDIESDSVPKYPPVC